jgi:type IV secretory pathway VirB10-like protein
MADKSPKFIDIKAPEKSKPSTTSRPVIVTNRPVLGNDPMVNPDQTDETKSAVPMTRTGKTISPVSEGLIAPEETKEESADAPAPEKPELETAQTEEPKAAEAKAEEPAEAPKPEPEPEEDAAVESSIPTGRDAAAESHADEAKAAAEAEAAATRQNQLEEMIASGKFNAPINAVHRKRSQVVAVLLVLVAILLAVVVADAALDAGLISIDGVPHTDFLKDK